MSKRNHRRSGIYWCDKQKHWIIDKNWKGQRIYLITYTNNPDEAEALLDIELDKLRKAALHGERPAYVFHQAAERYLLERQETANFNALKRAIVKLMPFIGDKPLSDIHDGTLQAFIKQRIKAGVETRKKDPETGMFYTVRRDIKYASINRELEVVRTILISAWRRWRCDLTGKPWLDSAPIITMLPTKPKKGKPAESHSAATYSLSWAEQDRLFPLLSARLQKMCLFKVNTGTREQEVCQLRWEWEHLVPELGISVFIVPEGYVKNGEARLIVLNKIAQSVIEAQRKDYSGKSDFVFPNPSTGKPFTRLQTTSWKEAWIKAGLPTGPWVRQGVHTLKHTCGRRLRAAGVSRETRKVCLGHRNGDITTHYSAAEVQELLDAFESLCERKEGIVLRTQLRAVS